MFANLRSWFRMRRYLWRNNNCHAEGRHGGPHDPCGRPEGCWCHNHWASK